MGGTTSGKEILCFETSSAGKNKCWKTADCPAFLPYEDELCENTDCKKERYRKLQPILALSLSFFIWARRFGQIFTSVEMFLLNSEDSPLLWYWLFFVLFCFMIWWQLELIHWVHDHLCSWPLYTYIAHFTAESLHDLFFRVFLWKTIFYQKCCHFNWCVVSLKIKSLERPCLPSISASCVA